MNIYPCKKGVPADIFTDYLYRDSDFILVKDPKHNEDYFHYTIWSLNGISTIFDMTRIDINDLKRMINKVDKNFDRFDPILDRLFIIFVGLVCIFGFYIIFETFGPEDMVNKLKSYITSIQKELGLE